MIDSVAAATQMSRLALNAAGERVPLETVQVTASLFDVLRVPPLFGRVFTEANETEGNHHVAVISYGLWQRQFGGDPAAVGQPVIVTRTAVLGGVVTEESLTVLGVMPRGFAYPMSVVPAPDIWTPYVMSAEERTNVRRGQYLHVVGRLLPHVSIDRAQAEIRSIAASWSGAEAEFMESRQFHVVSLKDTPRRERPRVDAPRARGRDRGHAHRLC